MLFSIIIASFNPGVELKKTVDSILEQSLTDYEIIIKDAISQDNSLESLPKDTRIRVISQKDSGIYDGMNQALQHITGEYVLFLNCGDYLYERDTLEKMASVISKDKQETIYYGNQYNRKAGAFVSANPSIDGFACYRHLPCHQACVYSRTLFSERGYNASYAVRADYEHFLWCYYVKKIVPVYMDLVVCSYEGGGFSETKKGMELSAAEHKEITEKYMSKRELQSYRLKLLLTLAPVRKMVAENPMTAKLYQSIKTAIYRK